MNIEYKHIPLDEQIIDKLENIRYNAYEITNQPPIKENYHYRMLQQNKYLVYGCYLNDQLVGACYISNSYNSLYIEQLFIKKQYQKTGLYLGKNLLTYILTQKDKIEKHFNTTINYSYLDSTPNSINLYKSLGYKETKNLMRKYLA